MSLTTKGTAAAMLAAALDDHAKVFAALPAFAARVEEAAARMVECLSGGGKVCWMGNGGSAADAQHLAAELVGRFTRERRGLASIAFTTDTSILTAIGNDYGYEAVFARQVEALCRPGDVVVGITTSGNSPNVVAALRKAAEVGGVYRVGFTGGTGGLVRGECDLLFNVAAPATARVQEAHLFLGHVICDAVEAAFAPGAGGEAR